MEDTEMMCIGCHKHPSELYEYSPDYTGEDMTAAQFVAQEEGTLNPENGHFLCTECYFAAGLPSSRYGWVAP